MRAFLLRPGRRSGRQRLSKQRLSNRTPASLPETISRETSHLPTLDDLRLVGYLLLLFTWFSSTAHAQYPGELTGRVTDAVSRRAVEHVVVEVLDTGTSTVTDGRGEFYLRGLEPGRHRVKFSRLGYETKTLEVAIRNGQTSRLNVRLGVRPLLIDEVRGQGEAAAAGWGVLEIGRAEIESSGELTAAGLLQGRAGLLVRSYGPTSRKSISIRGSSADEVLVLLDGAPLNDPITGVADLSTISASQIESLTVLRGAASAVYGPGAAAGVVRIESRRDVSALRLRLETGSLGYWSGAAEFGKRVKGWSVSTGGQARAAEGDFEYELPAVSGVGVGQRSNADLFEATLFGAASGGLAGGELRLRAGFERLERGLPGPSFLPTPTAREELDRFYGHAGWEGRRGQAQITAQLHTIAQDLRLADPSPPLGLPYDSRATAKVAGGRLAAELERDGPVRSLSAGLEARGQRFESTELAAAAPRGRLDFGLFAGGEIHLGGGRLRPRLAAALRLDHDDLSGLWWLNHGLTLTAQAGPVALHARHASATNPPTLGDQFFREGVAVQPNPDLRGERIPHDLSLGADLRGAVGRSLVARVGLAGYAADVEDMILWAPDFRFVWSPRNFDVKRRGLEIEAALEAPSRSLTLEATYTLARVTYDRPGDDTVQVMYRPRHSGSVGARWNPGVWEARIDARFVGIRYPVPAPLNALDPYWTIDLRLRHAFRTGVWEIVPTLSIDRLLDHEDSLIFGYPEPGRTVRLEVAVQPRKH